MLRGDLPELDFVRLKEERIDAEILPSAIGQVGQHATGSIPGVHGLVVLDHLGEYASLLFKSGGRQSQSFCLHGNLVWVEREFGAPDLRNEPSDSLWYLRQRQEERSDTPLYG